MATRACERRRSGRCSGACRVRRCCRATSPASPTAIKDPLTGQPFPGNIIPSSRFSNFAKTLGPTVPAPNNPGANNYHGDQAVHDDADTADDAARPGNQLQKHNLFERFLYYNGSAAQPVAVQLHGLPADRPQSRRRRNMGDFVADRQRDSVRLQLRLSI